MKGKRCGSSESSDGSDEGREEYAAQFLEEKPVVGDVIWAKLYDGSWWPGVIVDDKAVSKSSKPGVRSTGDVLVRPYGSYQYLYVNPTKCRSDFEIALQRSDDCSLELIRKALEQDLPYLKSVKSTGQGSKSKGLSNGRVNASKGKKSYQNEVGLRVETSSKGSVSVRNKRNAVTPPQNAKDDIVDLDGVIKKLYLDTPDRDFEDSKWEMSKHDEIQKEQKQNGSRAKGASRKASKQDSKRKRLKQRKNDAASEERQTPEGDDESNAAEPNSPGSGGTFFGRLQELRARRTKVMKNLGLAAPSDSPFR